MDESSHALPSYCYGDPSNVVERRELSELGCRACSKHTIYFDKILCTEPKMTKPKKVPNIGSKCKYFELKVV